MPHETALETRHEALAEFWERIELVVYLGLIAVVVPRVSRVMADAWHAQGLAYSTVIEVEQLLGISHLRFFLLGAGVYTGLVTLLWVDEMKRIHAFLLTVASLLATGVFESRGLIFSSGPLDPGGFVQVVTANADVLAVGFGLGVLLGGGAKIRTSEPPWEFRRATEALFWMLTVFAGVALFENHLLYENPIGGTNTGALPAEQTAAGLQFAGQGFLPDFAAVGTFVVGAYLFTSYEASTDVFWVGVQRAGKTLGNAALFHGARESATRTNTRLNPSQPLSKLHSSLTGTEDGWGDHEFTGPTNKGEYHLHRFVTRSGVLFKKYVTVEALDYAGEYINDVLVEHVERRVPKSRRSVAWILYKYEQFRGVPRLEERASNLVSEGMYELLSRQIVHSDKLLLVVDSGSLVSEVPYGENDYDAQATLSEYISIYVQILRHLNESVLPEKDVVLVVTKADYLYQLYRQTDTSLPFFSWVNFYLLETAEGQETFGTLLNQADVDAVYPIYFELDHEESLARGEPVPEHPLAIHGNETLLERIKDG